MHLSRPYRTTRWWRVRTLCNPDRFWLRARPNRIEECRTARQPKGAAPNQRLSRFPKEARLEHSQQAR
jgi:hypothetical protein